MEYQRPTKMWNWKFIYLFAVSIIVNCAINMITPVLPKYIVSMGYSNTIAGTLNSMLSITALVARPISAAAADRLDRRMLVIASTGVISVTAILYYSLTSLPLLFITRIIQGVGFSMLGTVIHAYALNFVPEDCIGKGVAYFGLTYTVALALGPVIGLGLVEKVGFGASFLTAAGLCIFGLAAMILVKGMKVPTPERKTESGIKQKVKLSDFFATELIPIMLFTVAFSLGSAMTSNFLALVGDERGIANISLYYTVYSVLLFAIKPVIGGLIDRSTYSPYIIIPSFIFEALAMFTLGFANNIALVVLAAVFVSLGVGVNQPATQAECHRRLGHEHSGLAVASYYIGADVGNGVGAILGGVLSDKYGFGSTFYITAAIIVVFGIFYFFYRKYSKVYRSVPVGFSKK